MTVEMRAPRHIDVDDLDLAELEELVDAWRRVGGVLSLYLSRGALILGTLMLLWMLAVAGPTIVRQARGATPAEARP